MRMLIAAVIGGVVIGLVEGKLLAPEVQKHLTDPANLALATAALAAFLGCLWGWVAKGVFARKANG
jgi:ABC-type uncharacterized transport system permease subunit